MGNARALCFLIGSLTLFTACGSPGANSEEELAEARAGIQKSNEAFMAAVKARSSSQLVEAYYADDAVVLPPNQDPVSGKTQVESFFAGMIQSGVQDVSLTTDRLERNGPMAHEIGRYTMTLKTPQGETITDRGKYIVVWGLQPDGKWKARADIFNTSLPPQPAPASSPTSPSK